MENIQQEIIALRTHVQQQENIATQLTDQISRLESSQSEKSKLLSKSYERAPRKKPIIKRTEKLIHKSQDLKYEINKVGDNKIKDLENTSRYLSKKVQEHEAEVDQLKKLNAIQEKSIAELKSSPDLALQRKADLQAEIRNQKDKLRRIISKEKQQDAQLQKQHEKMSDYELRVRRMRNNLRNSGTKPQQQPQFERVTQEDIDVLRSQIDEYSKKKKYEEGQLRGLHKDLENDQEDQRYEESKLRFMLSDKEKELRLNQMRVKDLRKIARLSPIQGHYNDSASISYLQRDPLTVPVIEQSCESSISQLEAFDVEDTYASEVILEKAAELESSGTIENSLLQTFSKPFNEVDLDVVTPIKSITPSQMFNKMSDETVQPVEAIENPMEDQSQSNQKSSSFSKPKFLFK